MTKKLINVNLCIIIIMYFGLIYNIYILNVGGQVTLQSIFVISFNVYKFCLIVWRPLCYKLLRVLTWKFELWHDCVFAALNPVNCASPVQWSSPSRRLTTALSCCRASSSVIRSMTHVHQCLWLCMWLFSFQMAWTRCFTPVTIAHSLVWWWVSSGSLGPRVLSACRMWSGLLTSLK